MVGLSLRLGLGLTSYSGSRALGSELVVSPYTGGETGSSAWTISDTQVDRNGEAVYRVWLDLDREPTSGADYLISFTVAGKSGDNFFVRLGSQTGTPQQIASDGDKAFILASGGTEKRVYFGPWSGTTGEAAITLVSVRALGAELVSDTGFDDSGAWSTAGTWTVSGSKASVSASNGAITLGGTSVIAAGATYRVTFTIDSISAGSITPRVGLTNGTARTAPGTYTEEIVADSTFNPQLDAGLNTTAQCDNFSVRRIL